MSLIEDCSNVIRQAYISVMNYAIRTSKLDWKNGVELTDEEVSWIAWLREQGYRYIARGFDGCLVAFEDLPFFEGGEWRGEGRCLRLGPSDFFGLVVGVAENAYIGEVADE